MVRVYPRRLAQGCYSENPASRSLRRSLDRKGANAERRTGTNGVTRLTLGANPRVRRNRDGPPRDRACRVSGFQAPRGAEELPQDDPVAGSALCDQPPAQPRSEKREKRGQRLFTPDKSCSREGVSNRCDWTVPPVGRSESSHARSDPQRRVASCMEAFAQYLRATLRRGACAG